MHALVNYYYHAFTLIEPKVKLPPAAPGAFAMRARLGFFGHNAPALIPGTGNTGMQSQDLSSTTIWRTGDADCYLERTVPGISDNSWLVLDLKKQLAAFRVTTANEASLAEFGLSGKATGLVLDSGTVKDDKYRRAPDHGPRAERAAGAGAVADRSRRSATAPPKNSAHARPYGAEPAPWSVRGVDWRAR